MVPFLRHVCLKDQETWFDGASLVPSMIYHFQMVGKFCSSLGGFNTYSMAGTNTLGFKTDSMGLSSNRVCGISDCLGELTCSKKTGNISGFLDKSISFLLNIPLHFEGPGSHLRYLYDWLHHPKPGTETIPAPLPGKIYQQNASSAIGCSSILGDASARRICTSMSPIWVSNSWLVT